MMMNERVDMGRRGGSAQETVVEKLAVLHRTLKRIAKARAHLDLQEAEALRDAQRLQLWKQFGHTSLADYMVRELGYASHRVAEDRLRLANALPQLPKIEEAIQNGDLNMSQARELVRVATKENEQAWIDKAKTMNVREVEQAVSGHAKGDLPDDPVDEKLVRKTLWLSVRPETEVMFRKVRQVLDRERGERLDDDAVMEALLRLYLSGARTSDGPSHPRGRESHSPVVGPSSPASASVKATGDRPASSRVEATNGSAVPRRVDAASGVAMKRVDARDGAGDVAMDRVAPADRAGDVAMDRVDAADRAGDVAMNLGAPYRVAVTVCSDCKRGWQHGGGAVELMSPPAVERAMCDAQWIGDVNGTAIERARQEISPAMRRNVLHRDQERCQAPGCKCYRNLDVHHIVHLALGGTNEMANLITLCEAHHLAHHDGTLVITISDGVVLFKTEGRNNFTRVTREVATKAALRERGYDRDATAEIMRRTVTHVGVNDLSEEQWLAIALRYADDARSSLRPVARERRV